MFVCVCVWGGVPATYTQVVSGQSNTEDEGGMMGPPVPKNGQRHLKPPNSLPSGGGERNKQISSM